MGDPVLRLRVLNRALVDRQLLAERATISVPDALTRLVGLQAQAVNPPYIGLWSRMAEFALDDLGSMLTDRRAVRMALMRSTIHLVIVEDCLALRPLLAESLARMVKGQFGKQIGGVPVADITKVAGELLEERPLTFAELGRLLAARWPGGDPNALAQTARNLVPMVQLPPRGLWSDSSAATHTTVGRWLGRDLRRDGRVDEYVVRYLDAFGPASVADMQKWSGLTRLASAFTRLGARLRTYRDENGVVLHDVAGRPLPSPDVPCPVRYLPEYDNVLLSHADRSRIISDEHRSLVANGSVIRSTILVDGFVAGRWRIDRARDGATLVVEPFRRLAQQDQEALEAEGGRLLRFAASDSSRHDVRIDPTIT